MNTQEAAEQVKKLLDFSRNGGPWVCGEMLLVHDVNILQDLQRAAPALRVLLAAVEGQEGMVMVPEKPTEAMINAGWDATPDYESGLPEEIYKAMLARHTGSGKS